MFMHSIVVMAVAVLGVQGQDTTSLSIRSGGPIGIPHTAPSSVFLPLPSPSGSVTVVSLPGDTTTDTGASSSQQTTSVIDAPTGLSTISTALLTSPSLNPSPSITGPASLSNTQTPTVSATNTSASATTPATSATNTTTKSGAVGKFGAWGGVVAMIIAPLIFQYGF